jgi:hypothetical protein
MLAHHFKNLLSQWPNKIDPKMNMDCMSPPTHPLEGERGSDVEKKDIVRSRNRTCTFTGFT